MARPSSTMSSDVQLVIQLQLAEIDERDAPTNNLLSKPQKRFPESSVSKDSALKWAISDEEHAIARDAAFAQSVAQKDLGHPRLSASGAGPSSNPTSASPPHSACSPLCSAQMQRDTSAPPVKCGICFELMPDVSRFPPAECGHVFCIECMRQYLIVIATDTQKYPFACPGCRGTGSPAWLDPQTCLNALAGTGRPYFALEKLILERQHVQCLRYCANKSCSMPFDFLRAGDADGASNASRVSCPLCKTDTCVDCMVPWHTGRSCAQFRDEQNGDGVLQRLAKHNRWTACPRCKVHIERQEGDCNFVRCRCACGYCHKCGKAYLSLQATRNNEHGRPACTCALFEDENIGEPQVAPPPQENFPQEVFARAHVRFAAPEAMFKDDWDVPAYAPRDKGLVEFTDIPEQAPRRVAGAGRAPVEEPDLDRWLHEDSPRLSARMLGCLRENRCPYPECDRKFSSIGALEQHLAHTRRHAVFLCCGRPFSSRRALHAHQDEAHR